MHRFDERRRQLLRAGTALGLGAATGMGVLRHAVAASTAPRTLIAIHLAGGNDSLNTVIPYATPAYARIRGTLAIPADSVLKLDGRTGLNPALKGLKALWDRKRVAVVHGVGYPDFDYSHFQAMEIFWTADPARSTVTGWLGRAIDTATVGATRPDPLTGMAIGSGMQPSLIAQRFTAPQLPADPAGFWLPSVNSRHNAALEQVLQQPAAGINYLYDGFLRSAQSALGAYDQVLEAKALTPGATYPDTTFAKSLRFATQLMRSDEDVRVVTLSQGAYDTHENQLPTHARLLGELDAGLSAFFADLDRNGLANRVLVLLWSEFSRRVLPNANAGTDHGAAQAMVLIGPGVRPTIFGTAPTLADDELVEGGNLPMQFDFRRIYAETLGGWLGIDPRPVLGASYPALDVLL